MISAQSAEVKASFFRWEYVLKEIKCWVCGKKATITKKQAVSQYSDYEILKQGTRERIEFTRRCYCDICYDEYARTLASENELYLQLQCKRMMESAIEMLEHQNLDIWQYKEAIEAVAEYKLEHPEKFDSAGEIIAAIMLIQNHIRIKPQYKIERFQVDFLLPDEKIILEIDGFLHKHKQGTDSVRDEKIQKILGSEWQIVRLPESGIKKNARKIVKAIDAVIEHRCKVADANLRFKQGSQ
jgi:very-short-patch-repair endonuclease